MFAPEGPDSISFGRVLGEIRLVCGRAQGWFYRADYVGVERSEPSLLLAEPRLDTPDPQFGMLRLELIADGDSATELRLHPWTEFVTGDGRERADRIDPARGTTWMH